MLAPPEPPPPPTPLERLVTEEEAEAVSDELIEHVNSKAASWVAGRSEVRAHKQSSSCLWLLDLSPD